MLHAVRPGTSRVARSTSSSLRLEPVGKYINSTSFFSPYQSSVIGPGGKESDAIKENITQSDAQANGKDMQRKRKENQGNQVLERTAEGTPVRD